MDESRYLPVNWPENTEASLENVHALTTLRTGGVSHGDYSSFNLATHVDDDLTSVLQNRKRLSEDLNLRSEPAWLEQVHSNKVIRADEKILTPADASYTRTKGVVCTVLTADCLPVFFCNITATEVAVAHAGWRGLHAGIITKTIEAMRSSEEDILVSLGPAIGPQSFEVGREVFDAFIDNDTANESAFVATTKDHYLCDIYQLARLECQALGVKNISGGEYCTYRDTSQFYSFRRQSRTGRMANLIWID